MLRSGDFGVVLSNCDRLSEIRSVYTMWSPELSSLVKKRGRDSCSPQRVKEKGNKGRQELHFADEHRCRPAPQQLLAAVGSAKHTQDFAGGEDSIRGPALCQKLRRYLDKCITATRSRKETAASGVSTEKREEYDSQAVPGLHPLRPLCRCH